jgi:hypothetical protein
MLVRGVSAAVIAEEWAAVAVHLRCNVLYIEGRILEVYTHTHYALRLYVPYGYISTGEGAM